MIDYEQVFGNLQCPASLFHVQMLLSDLDSNINVPEGANTITTSLLMISLLLNRVKELEKEIQEIKGYV